MLSKIRTSRSFLGERSMRLRAKVKITTGAAAHYEGRLEGDALIKTEQLPPAAIVEIQDSEHGFYLLRFDAEGDFVGDTWHPTLEEAKRQALFEFELEDQGWREVEA